MIQDYIVRIYRFEKDEPRALVGLVEIVGKKGRLGFTNMDELWEILNFSLSDGKKEEEAEAFEFTKKRRIS